MNWLVIASSETFSEGTTNSDALDVRIGSKPQLWLHVIVGTLATGVEYEATVEESDDGSTGWAGITGASIKIYEDTPSTHWLGLVRLGSHRKNYVRVVSTATGGDAETVTVGLELADRADVSENNLSFSV